jgi:hypothetical protein
MIKTIIEIKKKFIRKIIDFYWWNNLYNDFKNLLKCVRNVNYEILSKKKAFHLIWMTFLWKKIKMNIVHMSLNKEKHYLIIIYDDFFDWTKMRVLFKTKTWWMTKIFEENVICKHDYFETLIMNDESENKKILDEFIWRYEIWTSSSTLRRSFLKSLM